MAVDINTAANNIYKLNFPGAPLHSFGIEKLTLKTVTKLNVDAILMSPPCQPFTRVGKKQDNSDIRTQSFLHLLNLIKELERKPSYILIENVKGFEISQTHAMLTECLDQCNYSYQEFLLTPLQFRIPNSRLRYYLIAKWKEPLPFPVQKEIMTSMPPVFKRTIFNEKTQHSDERVPDFPFNSNSTKSLPCTTTSSSGNDHDAGNRISNTITDCQNIDSAVDSSASDHRSQCIGKKRKQEEMSIDEADTGKPLLRNAGRNMRYCEEEDEFITPESRPLSQFMEEGTVESFKDYLLSDKELRKFVVMDVVFPELKKSTCFTKRYGHYVEGAGSVVQMTTNVKDVIAASNFKCEVVEKKNSRDWGETELGLLRKLKLRYFTPREVANLMCFPLDFCLPADVPKVQLYRVLGNSLNVHVVAQLIKLMTQDGSTDNADSTDT